MARHNLELQIGRGETLDVVRFSVEERMNALFDVDVTAVAPSPSVDFDAAVGHPAAFRAHGGTGEGPRSWFGLCRRLDLIAVEESGLSTYRIRIAPTLWLATQRRNHRMFQQKSELDIALQILAEWRIEPVVRADPSAHKKRAYRVQYAESDYEFVRRVLEDAGISFFFEDHGDATRLVLTDAPHRAAPRPAPLRFHDSPDRAAQAGVSVATAVRIGQEVRPGRYTVRDNDPRLPPDYRLMAEARTESGGIEDHLERFHYVPGAFLYETDRGEGTPVADDRGKFRSDEVEARRLAERRLHAKRAGARLCSFETNAHDVAPGQVIGFLDHPHPALAPARRHLVLGGQISGTHEGEWAHTVEACSADIAYHPPLSTPKPRALGVESATVVGPAGEEIHTDELGRVRVHFHWDRYDRMDEKSSCWVPVSHAWAGSGYGGMCLPRVGQEVLVGFLGGDPDRPVVVGRLYTATQAVPYGLPAARTQSGWKSMSSPGGGGYNEIMLEDAKGKELINIQAERDLNKLVKNDETREIGHDRTTTVVHDETVTIGNDRSKTVQMNERELVGMNRSRVVGVNESVQVGGSQKVTVAKASAETVGVAKALTVGTGYQVSVGVAMNTTVGLTSTEQVGFMKTIHVGKELLVDSGKKVALKAGKTFVIEAGDQLEIKCGAASITLKKDGWIGISCATLHVQATRSVEVVSQGTTTVASTAKTTVSGKPTWITSEGQLVVGSNAEMLIDGSKVTIQGDPVDINP